MNNQTAEKIIADLMQSAIHAARRSQSNERVTFGTAKRKTAKEQQIDDIKFDVWVRALWIAHDRRFTPDYFRSAVLKELANMRASA